MRFLLLLSILGLVLQSSFCVEPTKDLTTEKPEEPTSADLNNGKEKVDSITTELPSSTADLESTTKHHRADKKNEVDSTTTELPSSTVDHESTTKWNRVDKKDEVDSTTTELPSSTVDLESTTKLDRADKKYKPEEKQRPTEETSTLSSRPKRISKNNLIKVGQWKYDDHKLNKTRYWYERLDRQMGPLWIFDGFVFQAYAEQEENTEPVYGFHAERDNTWTNTFQMDSKPPTIGDDQWVPDNVVFYAYKTSMDSDELRPITRYWNKLDESVKHTSETRLPYHAVKGTDNERVDETKWTADQILFYVLPLDDSI